MKRRSGVFLGIDLGTHSVKVLVLGLGGEVIAETVSGYALFAPHPGWSETPTSAWWEAVVDAVRRAVGGSGDDVRAIGLSGQMHGVVLAGARGEALRPAILWADTRATEELAAFGRLSEAEREVLANPIAVGMAGATLLWLKRHEPALYAASSWALQPKDWLRAHLTGEVKTDPSDASGTLLYDVVENSWAEGVVAQLGLRRDLLPEVSPSGSVGGTLQKGAAAALGIPAGVPVAVGAADTAAAAFGSGLVNEGDAQLTVGSGAQIIQVTNKGESAAHEGVHLYRNARDGFYLMAAVQNAGLALEWVLSSLGLTWDAAYKLASTAPPGCEGLVFLPYLTGERTPHLNPYATGTWHGIGRFHHRGHLVRSALEGVAFALKDGLAALCRVGGAPQSLHLAGGSSSFPFWRQILADVLEQELRVSAVKDASARGAALLAMQAAGHEFELSLLQATVVTPGSWGAGYERAYSSFGEVYAKLYR